MRGVGEFRKLSWNNHIIININTQQFELKKSINMGVGGVNRANSNFVNTIGYTLYIPITLYEVIQMVSHEGST